MIACFILYGLLLSGSRAGWTVALVGSMIFPMAMVKKKTYNQSQTNSFEIRFSAYHHRFYHINLLYKKRFGRW